MAGDTATPGTKPNPQGGNQSGAQGGSKANPQGGQGGAQGGAAGGVGRGAGGTGGATHRRDNAQPGGHLAPVIDGKSLIQLTPQALQQLLANAVASTPGVSAPALAPAPKCPKFWDQEPLVWFMVFRGHYEGRNLCQLDRFKALLPLLSALAVSLCRPLVTAPTPTVMDDAQ